MSAQEKGSGLSCTPFLTGFEDLWWGWLDRFWIWIDLYLPRFFLACLIFGLGFWGARWIQKHSKHFLSRTLRDEVLSSFLAKTLYISLLLLTIIIALAHLGVQTTSIIAVLGAAGFAIALSLKDSLSNLASGIMLVLFRHFTLGDTIEVNGVMGRVEEISLFHTRVITPDNRAVILPNASITSSKIVNVTAAPTRRVEWKVCVTYEADIEATKRAIAEAIAACEAILGEPEPMVGIDSLAEGGVRFILRAWVKSDQLFLAQSALNECLKISLDRAKIPLLVREGGGFSAPRENP